MADRGVYTCIARSNVTNEEDTDTCMVRVKGKLLLLFLLYIHYNNCF